MKPILTGITGGIGSGKTIVCKILMVMGYRVFDADSRSKQLLANDVQVKTAIQQVLGKEAYFENGTPDKQFIATAIFSDREKLQAVNHILHPAVQLDFENWVSDHLDQQVLFKEAAILFESGSYKQMEMVISVSAPENLRIERVMQRDNKTETQIRKVMSEQISEQERNSKSDFVIINDGSKSVVQQVLTILNKIKAQ